ncbi:uncharacterized protein LTR77_010344 [Saxophila tyrrhenica]|uniref:Bud22 domain-containing protein n=1 Tax=Saxophila tyrrhenica TaxID=1690608 RepID=A0AAV9NVU9_9PEZI|nr:hypothetical protein LTR77_010344 [Saxophila tyrrhenica]
MPKRKRNDDGEDDPAPNISVKKRRVQIKLKSNVAKLRHAFKVAKGFERQKLSRRRKDAVSKLKEKDVDRIDAEVAALKTLDIDTLATHHFHKTLCKSKAVAEHQDLPSEVKDPAKLPPDTATLNVSARLCNSNPVQTALKAAVSDVRRALGIHDEDGATTKRKRIRANGFPKDDSGPSGKAADRQATSTRKEARSPAETEGPDGESESEDGFDAYDERLAASSDNDGGEDMDVAELERQLANEGVKPQSKKLQPSKYNVAADLSLSEDEPDRSSSPEPSKAVPTKASAFVPSLTMGGYISGSGSDIEDVDVAPKRNRRGQRARQQIWEQKFGAKAKHLQRQDRNTGWDAKRGAVNRNERRGHGGQGGRARRASPDYARGGQGNGRANARPIEKKQDVAQERPMHPSWEAAKKAKEKREAPVAFQGKKVTFD